MKWRWRSLGKKRYKLFVYGTLKKAHCNEEYLKDAQFIDEATTTLAYPMIAPKIWYPYLIDAPGEGRRVKGELYMIDDETLAKIDALEEYPHYYTRKTIGVEDSRGRTHHALCYFLKEPIEWRNYPLLEKFESKKQ